MRLATIVRQSSTNRALRMRFSHLQQPIDGSLPKLRQQTGEIFRHTRIKQLEYQQGLPGQLSEDAASKSLRPSLYIPVRCIFRRGGDKRGKVWFGFRDPPPIFSIHQGGGWRMGAFYRHTYLDVCCLTTSQCGPPPFKENSRKAPTVDGEHAPLPQPSRTHLSSALKWTLKARRPQAPTTLTLFMRQNFGHVSVSMRARMMQR